MGRNENWLLYRSRLGTEEYIAITLVPLRRWSVYGGERRRTKNEQTWYSRLQRMSIWPYRGCKILPEYFPLTCKCEVVRLNMWSLLRRKKIDLLRRNSRHKRNVKDPFLTLAMVLHKANPVQLTGSLWINFSYSFYSTLARRWASLLITLEE